MEIWGSTKLECLKSQQRLQPDSLQQAKPALQTQHSAKGYWQASCILPTPTSAYAFLISERNSHDLQPAADSPHNAPASNNLLTSASIGQVPSSLGCPVLRLTPNPEHT
jgi:hypothetical protein